MIATLHRWADLGWLRRLDSALAAFMRELDPATPSTVLISTAILSQMEARGHTCLPLNLLVSQPNEVLAWPEAAQDELRTQWATLPPDLDDWLAALHASPLVRSITSEDTERGQPLVLCGTPGQPLLYLRRYWLHEQQVARNVLACTTSLQAVDEGLVRQWLDRLFDPPSASACAADSPMAVVDWQKAACAVAMRASLTIVTGGPGTGKTYTVARLLALLFATDRNPGHLRVALAAPTGKAAARLRQSIDTSLQELCTRLGADLDLATFTQRIGAAKTLHALLGARPDTRAFRFNAHHLLDVDVLIVDEASMIHLEMMSALLQAMPPGARLILLGDKDQLASVEAGAVLGDLCRDAERGDYSPATAHYIQRVAGQALPALYISPQEQATALSQQTVMLRTSRRFGGKIAQLASAVNSGNSVLAHQLISHDTTQVLYASFKPSVATVLDLAVHGRPGGEACYADYLHCMNVRPKTLTDPGLHALWVKSILTAFDRFRILCAVHEGEWGTHNLNQGIGQALAAAHLLKPRGEWFAGRPVMVTRNDSELGVSNGDVGLALPGCQSAALRVYFLDGDSLRSVGVSRLAHVETAFAMTVHKSQGSEFLHTALVLPEGGAKILTRELVYTGITRARESFTLIEGQAGLLRQATEQKSQRASGLHRLWAPIE